MRGDEVAVVDARVGLAELGEEGIALGAQALLLTLEEIRVDVAGSEDIHEAVLLLIEGGELHAVGLGGLEARHLRFAVRGVERMGHCVRDVVGDGDEVDGFAERVEDVVLTDVDLSFATVDVRAPAVCASVVAVLARVLASALHLRRERDLAAALGCGAPERERTLVEEALVLQFSVGALLAERRLQTSPLVGGEDGLVPALVPGASPGELTLEAVVRDRDGRVEVLLQVLLDRRTVVGRNHLRRDEALRKAGLSNAIEAVAREVQIHLPPHELASVWARIRDDAPAPLRSTMLIERGLLPVEAGHAARVPTVSASLLHAVDGLSLASAVVLLRLGDVDIEDEEVGVVAVLVEHRAPGCDVDDDLAVAYHLLENLRIRKVPGDSVPDVEDDVSHALGSCLRDGRVELRAERRLLRRLLEGLDGDDGEPSLPRVAALMMLLGIERDSVLLLPVADAADQHGAVVVGLPPCGASGRAGRLHDACVLHALSVRKISTSAPKSTMSSNARGGAG